MPVELKPQPGPQTMFFESSADIVIYGGAAGGGKSWSLLAECLRYALTVKGFGAVILRRDSTQIFKEGSLWDQAGEIYPLFGGKPNGDGYYTFPNGNTVTFSHLVHESTKYGYQGAQIPLICFDELTHFTASQFWYMLSRNRSLCGVKPYIRASTNPDADSWVADLIAWWLDEEGYPIPERSGQLRYFLRIHGAIEWGDSPEELVARFPKSKLNHVKSLTFIAAKLEDNRILMEKDPGYEANLEAQDFVERARLIGGNWKIRFSAGNVFKRQWFGMPISPAHVPSGLRMVRYWDLAATEKKQGNEPDWSTGTLMGVSEDGIYYVLDVVRLRGTPLDVENAIIETAHDDGKKVEIIITQEPGSAGKFVISSFTRHPKLKGFTVRGDKESGSKVERARPFSSQCEAGNVKILRGLWNDVWLNELQAFPDGLHDDMVDSASGAFRCLPRGSRIKTRGEAA